MTKSEIKFLKEFVGLVDLYMNPRNVKDFSWIISGGTIKDKLPKAKKMLEKSK